MRLTAVLITLSAFVLPACEHGQANPERQVRIQMTNLAISETAQPFDLPVLPYATDALAPAIDAQTMQIHHSRHHKAYIDNLNAAIASDTRLAGLSLEEIVTRASEFGPAVRNNAGGHWNHSLFWRLMAPKGSGGSPSPELMTAIEREFGSLEEMKRQFEAAGLGQFGSGWVWLVVANGRLTITSTPNQDNPLMDLAAIRGTPILGNDVWEHAYYLTYQNRRGAYLSAWWEVVNWNEVNRLYAEAIAVR